MTVTDLIFRNLEQQINLINDHRLIVEWTFSMNQTKQTLFRGESFICHHPHLRKVVYVHLTHEHDVLLC